MDLRPVIRAAQVPWVQNGLRKSFVSYEMARNPNAPRWPNATATSSGPGRTESSCCSCTGFRIPPPFDEVEVGEWARKGDGASARHAQSRINLLKPRL
jgi:hypothetical protein